MQSEIITTGNLDIRAVDVRCEDAQRMLNELSATLESITGHTAASGFSNEDVLQPRSIFYVAYINGDPVGCGGLRPMDDGTKAELKRVFAYPNQIGIGTAIVRKLEETAAAFGYEAVMLETRRTNPRAVAFYLKLDYAITEQYGKYVGRTNALCFYKRVRA